jgi:hypothetical protein
MPEDKELKEAMHSDHIKLPKRDKSKVAWIVISVILFLALAGLGAYGYMQINKLNKSISDKDATINDLQNKKKTLEDAAAAAAKAVVTAASGNYLEVKELGYKLPLTDDIKDLQYFVNGTTTFFSTASLQSSAWKADSSDAGMYCSLGSLPLGAISKFNTAAEAGPNQQKVLSGFVLGYAPPQSNCSTNQATIDLQTKQKASLLKAFNNAVKL